MSGWQPHAMFLEVNADGHSAVFSPSSVATIGRDNDADVVLSDGRVSRQHLKARFDADGQWRVADVGSANGTFDSFGRAVTDLVISGEVELRLGDAKGTAVRFRLVDPPEGSTVVFQPISESQLAPSGGVRISAGAGPTLRIGRDPENEIMLDDLLVSRHHAELTITGPNSARIRDLKSSNGVYVDGRRVRDTTIDSDNVLTIGRHNLVIVDGAIREHHPEGDLAFAVEGLRVEARTGAPILGSVSFEVPPRSLVAVLGPSGAGKSTVLKSIVGAVPAAAGNVFYGESDLLSELGATRRRIGYVPQDDILHSGLTVERSLHYAARIRLPPDATDAEIERRVASVLDQLGLTTHRHKRVEQLSGGQRKRTSTAMELLTEPPLLLLDEPTSGLDPGNEKALTELLADLAHERTGDSGSDRRVLVVTHSVQSLDLCDLVLMLAPSNTGEGARVAFYGPPAELLAHFGVDDYADVYRILETPGDTPPPAGPPAVLRPRATRASSAGAVRERPPLDRRRQFNLLLRRYIDVVRADRSNMILMVLQVPIVGVMLAAISGDAFVDTDGPPSNLLVLLLGLVLSMTYIAASNSVREIVKERPVLERELALGIDPYVYVASKCAVLGVITVLQALGLVLIGASRAGPLDEDNLLGIVTLSPRFELAVAVALAGLAAVGVALLVSALVPNADRAMSLLPVLLLAMYLLSGGPTDVTATPLLHQLSWLDSAQWGLSAVAKTADASELLGCNVTEIEAPPTCRDGWERSASALFGNLVMMALIATSTAVAAAALVPRKPRVR